MSFTVESVEAALVQLYNNTNMGYADANRYLTSMQGSREAWDIAWKLLDMNKPVEIQYFGANTLHNKISRHWHEITREHWDSLRTKLLQAIVQYSKGPRLILTRILVAMGSFVINVIPEFWSNAISDLLTCIHPSAFSSVSPNEVLDLLLELLTVIPEELQASERRQRGPSRSRLEASSSTVLEFLGQLPVLSLSGLRCYSSWSQLGFNDQRHLELLPRLVQCIHNPDLCRTACEVLSHVATHPEVHRFPSFVLTVVEQLVGLEGLLAERLSRGDQEACSSIYSLLMEVGECHSHLLVSFLLTKPQSKDTILKLFQLILQCSATEGQFPVDECWSRQALGFWYALQDDVGAWEGSQGEALLLALNPLWQALLETLLRKARLPLDDSHWSPEDKDSLRCYRQDIGDSLMYCYGVLRESLLATLAAHLELSTRALIQDPQQEWPAVEACVFALQSVAECVGVGDQATPYLEPLLARGLPALPSHVKVTPAVLSCIGAFGAWLQAHPPCLGAVLPLLLAGLEEKATAPAATLALKDVARDCEGTLGSHGPQVLAAAQRALTANVLGDRERVRVMGMVGHLLCQESSWLEPIVGPELQALNAAACLEPGVLARARLLQGLRMLAALLCGLTQEEPQAALLEHILQRAGPAMAAVVDNYCQDTQLVEVLCECLRRAASSLGSQETLHLLGLLVLLEQRCAHPCVLDTCRSMLIHGQTEGSRTALALLCQSTLDLVASANCFQENTHILEAFFQMLAYVTRKSTTLLVSDKVDLVLVFNCGIATIGLPEKGTVKAAAGFLAEFILNSQNHPQMADVINRCGELLIQQVLMVIGSGESPRSAVDPMADILLALTKKCFDQVCHWMTILTQRPNFPSSRVTIEEKEHFLQLLLKERSNKRRLKEIVSELSLVCRGLFGTEYAAQTFNSI